MHSTATARARGARAPFDRRGRLEYHLAVLSIGSVIDGRYEILGLLAEGGMGAVFRARRILLGDEVALKVIRATGHDAPRLRQRFMRESRVSAGLRHPHVVGILDFNIDAEGRPYLVMEFLNGRSLKDEIADEGPFDLEKVRSILPPLCTALQMAHDRGIFHRDLKTANIVSHRFDSGQTIYKIIDFGLANVREAADETRLTAAQHVVGTMAYASPEQLSAKDVDGRSDVYSLGIVIFEMLTGGVPFKGDVQAVVAGHLTAEPPAVTSLRPDLALWIDPVVAKALAKRAGDRWPSMTELARALAGPEGSAAAAVAPAIAAPSLLDRYEVDRRIGEGRLGSEVYAGTHRVLGHPVAIRVLRRAARPDWEVVRDRFLREARTLQIAHASILQVRDFGEDEDAVYVVTDLIEGTSLRERLDREGPLPWARLQPLTAQLVDATAAVHRRGGVLGVLTPAILRMSSERDEEEQERVLVSAAGIQQVQDLLATLDERALRGGKLDDAELRYVAPEVLTGRAPDVRSDLFTIGAVVYEMATGRVPYDAPTLPALLGAAMAGPPPPPRDRRPDLPEAAERWILTCLARDPAARFPSAKDALAEWKKI